MHKIIIAKHQAISEIYNQFSEVYPNLRLEFIVNPPLKSLDIKLIDLSRKGHFHSFTIEKTQSVEEVLNLFKQKLGLEVEIYRKLESSVVKTTFTKQWTLEYQNKIGAEKLI